MADHILNDLVEHVGNAVHGWFSGRVVRTEHDLELTTGSVDARIALADLADIGRYHPQEWEEMTAELTWVSVGAALRGETPGSTSGYEARRPLVRSMLVPVATLGTLDLFGGLDGPVPYGRPVTEELLEFVTMAWGPFGPRTVYGPEVLDWQVSDDELFADCRANLAADDATCSRVVEQGLPFVDVEEASRGTAATLALRPDLLALDAPLGPLGAFLAAPEMNLLRVHPIRTSASLAAPALLSQFAAPRYEEAEDELSPLVYHWRDGDLQALALVRDGSGRTRLGEEHQRLVAEIAALTEPF